MSAPTLTAADEALLWDEVDAADRVMAVAFVDRAVWIARGFATARAAGRAEFTSCELAATLCVDDRTAQDLIAEARLLAELPPIADAMRTGALRLPHARVLLDELLPLETAVALQVLDAVLGKVADRTPAQVRRVVRTAVIRADADAAEARRKEAARDREVFVRPEADGMALFAARLTAEQAMTAYALIDAHAKTYRDGRPADLARSDALLDLLRAGSGHASSPGAAPLVHVDVIVSIETALGESEEPARLRGYGPITAGHARQLLSNAVLRQVSTDPTTGRVIAVAVAEQTTRVTHPDQLHEALQEMRRHPVQPDADDTEPGYRPSTRLRRLITRTYPTCTFPSCTMPSSRCDLDHRIPWPHGPTSSRSLHPLSRKHHRAKQAGWIPTPQPDGSTTWTSPCGRRYRSPLAE